MFDETDSIESHVSDTLNAGARLLRPGGGGVHRPQCPRLHPVADPAGSALRSGRRMPRGESHHHLTREGATAIAASSTRPMPPARRCSSP